MKKLLGNHPFLLLGVATVLVGVVWHMSAIDPRASALDAAIYRFVYVLGFLFITSMRLTRAVTDNVAARGLLSLAMGLVPYLVADWLLRRRRRAHATTAGTAAPQRR